MHNILKSLFFSAFLGMLLTCGKSKDESVSGPTCDAKTPASGANATTDGDLAGWTVEHE